MRKALLEEYRKLWASASLEQKKLLLSTGFNPTNPSDHGVPMPHRYVDETNGTDPKGARGYDINFQQMLAHQRKRATNGDDDLRDEFTRDDVIFVINGLLSVLDESKEPKVRLHAACIKLALGVPGMPTMSDLAVQHGITRAGVSWHVKSIQRRLGVAPSFYMRSEKACQSMRKK